MRPESNFQARVRVASAAAAPTYPMASHSAWHSPVPYLFGGLAAPPPYPMASHSAWHSPVPYLFGGLAAMMGLITLALLILACSYWKLSSFLQSGEEDAAYNGNGDEKSGSSVEPKPTPYQEGIVVIMAGEDMPTFLATRPIASSDDAFAGKANGATSPGTPPSTTPSTQINHE